MGRPGEFPVNNKLCEYLAQIRTPTTAARPPVRLVGWFIECRLLSSFLQSMYNAITGSRRGRTTCTQQREREREKRETGNGITRIATATPTWIRMNKRCSCHRHIYSKRERLRCGTVVTPHCCAPFSCPSQIFVY